VGIISWYTGRMDVRSLVLAEIERFLAETGMSERAFGLAAVTDHRLVRRLREGRGVTLTTIERAAAFISAHRAKDCPSRRKKARGNPDAGGRIELKSIRSVSGRPRA
jgi:antitoxin (DNA-binding transcriptional repressor) of toxin-antitoxin stability system